jgi:16S rRNA (guanine527-N7)-methyltransferase
VFSALLRAKLDGIYELSPVQLARLEQHYEILTRWNRVLNLTSLRTVEEAVERHYCESVFAALQLPESRISVADIGSGGGFPGIPIAIVRPECAMTLIESHQRKAAFLKESVRQLGNVRILARRAEDVYEQFDWVVSRAVKYAEIHQILARMAPNVELLSGELEEVDLSGLAWEAPIRLPWGDRRFVWIGHAHVSRETPT